MKLNDWFKNSRLEYIKYCIDFWEARISGSKNRKVECKRWEENNDYYRWNTSGKDMDTSIETAHHKDMVVIFNVSSSRRKVDKGGKKKKKKLCS